MVGEQYLAKDANVNGWEDCLVVLYTKGLKEGQAKGARRRGERKGREEEYQQGLIMRNGYL